MTKLIIDIPEEDYKFIKDLQFYHSGRRSGKTIERNVINAIKNGKPYEERSQREWIPVREKLPDLFEVVLVTDEHGKVFEYERRPLDDDGNVCKEWSFLGRIIIAWMPMPEPYKAENHISSIEELSSIFGGKEEC